MNEFYNRNVVEAALLAAGKPLTVAELGQLFEESSRPNVDDIRAVLDGLAAEYSNRGLEVKETAAGFRIQVRREFAGEISRLWPERPAKYSRALLETLALIAYRQPITRAEIEAVRGVAVNPNIIKTVIERNWVRVVGHRDVPGRPELLGTTREFLDYFGLRSLDELPPLAELKAMGDYNLQLDLPNAGALEAPKGEGEVEGVAGLLGSDAAVVEAVAEAVESGGDGTGAQDVVPGERDSVTGATGDVVSDPLVDGSAAASDVARDAGAADAVAHDAVSDAVGGHDGVGDVDGLGVRSDAPVAALDVSGAHDDVVAADGRDAHSGGHDALLDAAGAHGEVAAADGRDAHSAGHEAVSHAVGAHDEVAAADGRDLRSGGHDTVSDAVGVHDEVAAADGRDLRSGGHDTVSDAVGVHDEVAAADGHDARSGGHDAVLDAVGAHDDVVAADGHGAHSSPHAAGAHHEVTVGAYDAVAKADIDDDTEADRTLSVVDAIASESQDALDDASEDDADEDELSADGHGSRELVAAPRDSDD